MTKRCVMCKTVNPNPLIKTCGYECSNAYLNSDKGRRQVELAKKRTLAKEERKLRQIKARKKEEAKGIGHWMKVTEGVMNRYVMLRDQHENCISCGASPSMTRTDSLTGSAWHAGHFRSVGSAPEMRFNLRNINKQCYKCNIVYSSNRKGYEEGIVLRFGQERLDYLTREHVTRNYTIVQLKRMRQLFTLRAKRYNK